MRLLGRDEILASLRSNASDTLWLTPLLDDGQVGKTSVDLRLGYDFLVSILTRKPYVSLSGQDGGTQGAEDHFQYTRRDIGERFVLYPGQVVLTTTLEHVSLPASTHAEMEMRSSFNRLGMSLSGSLRPGFRGCPSLELLNHGNNPVELIVGGRLVQLRLFQLDDGIAPDDPGKYYGEIRPTISRADRDADLAILDRARIMRELVRATPAVDADDPASMEISHSIAKET